MIHPADARSLEELGADYLVAVALARLGSPTRPHPGAPRFLAEELVRLDTPGAVVDLLHLAEDAVEALPANAALAAWLRDLPAYGRPADLEGATRQVERATPLLHAALTGTLAGRPFDPTAPLALQLDPVQTLLRDVLCATRAGLDRLAAPHRRYPLAAPLRVRAALPPRGEGGDMPLVEVGEATTAAVEASATPGLRWVHGVGAQSTPQAVGAARLLEAVARREPGRFWPAVDALRAAGGRPAALVGVVEDAGRVRRAAEGPEVEEGLAADRVQVDVCGVPTERPAFVLGTAVYAGVERLGDLRVALEGRRA